MKHVLLPDLTQASPQDSPRQLLTGDLGSTMRLFPPNADAETKIQVHVVYLEVIPGNTSRAVGKWNRKQHVTVSRFIMWASRAPSSGHHSETG